MMNKIKDFFKDWTRFEIGWLAVFTIVNIYLFFAWNDNVLGLITSLTGMMCVVLVAKGRISNYYWGIINVALYAYISYQNKYFGEYMLNAYYYFPMQFIGLWLWNRNRKKSDVVKVKLMSWRMRFIWLGISAASVYFYGLWLQHLGGNSPFIDSTSTVLSVIAQVLMVLAFMEQWILWIVVDVVSIVLWVIPLLNGGTDISMVVMWSAFLINAIYGAYNWTKMGRNANV